MMPMKKAPTGKEMSRAMRPTPGQIARNVIKTSAKEFGQGFTAFGDSVMGSMKAGYNRGKQKAVKSYYEGKSMGKKVKKLFK